MTHELKKLILSHKHNESSMVSPQSISSSQSVSKSSLTSSMNTSSPSRSASKHVESHTFVNRFLKDIIYGGLDGLITTFAIVAGVAGANLSSSIIMILGFANLLADGFSMAVGNYMGTKAEIELARKERRREEDEIDNCREEEIEEIRAIYRKKGFVGVDLERVVEVITSNKKVWVDTMMVEELGIFSEEKSPFLAALATFGSFLFFGMIPLLTYVAAYFYPSLLSSIGLSAFGFGSSSIQIGFLMTMVLTGTTIFFMGAWKSLITSTDCLRSGLEMFFVGGFAASLAYYVGYYLSTLQ